ncbi:MAG: VTT domain-containing protein [Pseudomonadota bacterium]
MTPSFLRAALPAVLIAVAFIAGAWVFATWRAEIEAAIGARAGLGMVVFVLIFAASIVLAPISSTPLIAAGAQLWGVWATAALSVIGWTAGAMGAFYLARWYGRPLVERMVPMERLRRLEALVPRRHIFWTIFLLRAVTPFDGLSYVLGMMSHIPGRTHFWATLTGLVPFCLTVSWLGSLPPVYLAAGLLAALGLAAAVFRAVRRRAGERDAPA